MSDEFHVMYQKNKQLLDLLFEANNADDNASIEIQTKMYNLLESGYQRLIKIGVADIHFYLKNDKSFLRMSHPLHRSDEVLRLKSSIIRTNMQDPLQEGFKLSGLVSGVVFTYPLFDKYNQYIGGVEITYSTKYLIENILDDFTYDVHLLLSKKSINRALLRNDVGLSYEKSWESDEYILDKVSHKTAKIVNLYHTFNSENIIKKVKKNINSKKEFSLSVVHNYIDIIMTFIPLQTIDEKENDVYLVTYTESDYLSELIRENKYLHIIFLSILLLMFVFVVYILLSRDKFEQLALYDNVTNLANRTLVMIELKNEINRASRNNTKIALMFIDLDGFKAVNDTYGHQVGDELLQYASNTFVKGVRKSDMVARVGGDEFIIILPNIKEHDEAVKVASNLIETISKPINLKDNEIKIGASIGISIYPEHATGIDALIKLADEMMYKSKANGKNRVTLYSS
jgi:diguanylate cyclase (GGDEF)-like protein